MNGPQLGVGRALSQLETEPVVQQVAEHVPLAARSSFCSLDSRDYQVVTDLVFEVLWETHKHFFMRWFAKVYDSLLLRTISCQHPYAILFDTRTDQSLDKF